MDSGSRRRSEDLSFDDPRSNILSELSLKSSDTDKDSKVALSLSNQTSIFSQESLNVESLQSELMCVDRSTISKETKGSDLSSVVISLGFCPRKAVEASNYKCIKTLQADSDGRIFSICLSQASLYSGTDRSDIMEWNLLDLSKVESFGNGDGAINASLVVGDNLISAHQDHNIRVWSRLKHAQRSPRHKLIATLPTVRNILGKCFHPKNYVHVRRHKKCLWIKHSDTISVLAKGPSNLLYSGSWDKTFKIWRLSDFECLESIAAHDDAINALQVSSNGYVYTASADAKIKVWERNPDLKHSLVAVLIKHKSTVNALALSKNDSLLYSGSGDRSILVWEREESAEHMVMLGALKGHLRAVLCLSTVANFLCSGSADKTIRLWRRESDSSHSCLAVLHGHAGPVKSLSTRTENESCAYVYSGGLDGQIKVWTISLTKEISSATNIVETQAVC